MCKVKSVIIAVFIIIPFILGAVVTVKPPGQGGDYDCIQDAIDDIEHEYVYEDTIEIYPSSGDDWEEDITINDINLRMIGIGDVSIKNRTGNTTILYTLSGNYQVALENLTIKNEDDEKVVYASASRGGSTSLTLIDCEFEGDSANYNRLVDTNMIEIVDISGCTFNGIQAPNYQNPCKLINCVDSDQIIITDNIFTGTSDYAICSRIHIDSEYACEISNNTISDCKYAILLDCSGDTEVEIKENLIFDLLNGAYALCIEKPSDPNDSEISFTNNTLYCSSGFTKYVFANATNEFVPTEIVNNIFHSFDGFMDNSATIPTEFDIDYNCCNVTLNDAGAGDTNNITGDPQFVDAGSDDYHLEQESPCIDSGDPSFDHDDDGTVSDMGYFTGDDHDLARFLESDGATVNINWIGFPRLDVTDGENNGEYVEATDMLDLLEYTDNPEEIEVYYLLSTSSLYGEWNNEYEYYDWDTDPCANLINSIRGYKIKVWDSGLSSSYLRVFGDVIDPETDITVDVRKDENWVCYFLEDTQDAEDAFSSGA
ncbi:MAG: hypothetical protein RAO94_11530, partial [Candidatus Stygibacter australis]|nr:hypothetical protein [Candidatus Stygibacter australis]